MTRPLDFDPYQLLGVDGHADASTIDKAYKARIRSVHPDIAGLAGLDETKRLNVAREWLLDPELRARLPRPAAPKQTQGAPREPSGRAGAPSHPSWSWRTDRPRRKTSESYDPLEDDPLTFDYGASTDTLRAFFETVRSISDDERARVSYSLGEEEPISFKGLEGRLDLTRLSRSRALEDAVLTVWNEREDEDPYFVLPRGILFGEGPAIANAYAQWLLLGDAVAALAEGGDLAALESKCTWPWQASIGHPRHGAHGREVEAFLRDAQALSVTSAERLARSWQKHMGSFLYGRPGDDWFPGALDQPKPALVGARVAAVDASRIRPPEELHPEHHDSFRYGLRLTAHVIALGGVADPRRDYLRPWRDAFDETPSFADRARWGMPSG